MKNIAKIWVLTVAVISLSSCAINDYYTPNPDTHPLDPIAQEFKSNKILSLINGQKDDFEQLYFENWSGKRRSWANYHTWTNVAIQILNRELTARNATIDVNAEESIKLAIVDVRLIIHTVTAETQITLEANLSDGYSASYDGINSVSQFGWNAERQIDGAIMRAVAAMLSDPKVVEFVRN